MPSSNRIVPTDGPFGVDLVNTSGLRFAFRGGTLLIAGEPFGIPNGSVLLADNSTNYVEIDDGGRPSVNQSAFTSGRTSLYQVTTAGGAIAAIQGARGGSAGTGTVWAGGVWG